MKLIAKRTFMTDWIASWKRNQVRPCSSSFFMLLIVFIANYTSAFASEEFFVQSNYPNRDRFSVNVSQPQNSISDTFIVFIYGGGCTFEANGNSLDLGKISDLLLQKGYSIVVPHYRQNLKFDAINLGNAQIQQQVCLEATKVYLEDLKKVIQEVQVRFRPARIFVWGHSFGAFLANVWATDPVKDSSIQGFISSNGWWEPTREYALDFLSPKSLSPLLQDPGALSRIFVIHTQDDSRVPVEQVDRFRKWVDPKADFRILIFPKGDHSPLNEKYPTTQLIEEISKFANP